MSEESPEIVVVWDPLVRVSHWALVACVVVAYLSPAGRSVVHETAGYAVLALVIGRILWGFFGTHHARLQSFMVSHGELGQYLRAMLLRKEPRSLGHNPAGTAMIFFLWGLILVICVTGWLLTWQVLRDHRPLQAWHGMLSDALVIAATIHLAGVLYASFRHGENLIWSMITGRKRRR